MTVLSTEAIRSRLNDSSVVTRLVISPLLVPDEQLKKGQGAIDIRLGFSFCLVTPSLFGAIDDFEGNKSGKLYPGQTIAQLFFHTVVDPDNKPSTTMPDNTQYVGTVDMIPQRISPAKTSTVLRNLIDRFEKRKV